MYKVIVDFKDLRDDGYEYKVGDTYPHTGEADAERVEQLMTPTSMRGALIEEVKVKETKKVEKAEEPAPATTKRRKKED